MSARLLIVFTAVAACAGASSFLVACATDDDTPVTEPDANVVVPSPDGGVEASTDGEGPDAEAVPCPSDALCPSESFGPQKPAGSLDSRVRIVMIRGRSPSDAWAVGARGTTLHFDGTSWKRSDPGTDNTINAIWPRAVGEVALSTLTTSAYTRGIELDDGTNPVPSAGGWTARAIPMFNNAPRGWLTSTWAPPGAEWLWCTTMEEPARLPFNGLWRLRVSPSTNTLEVGEAAPPGACLVRGCRHLASIHGATANDLWAVGLTGATIHITNAQGDSPKVTPFDSQTGGSPRSLGCFGDRSVGGRSNGRNSPLHGCVVFVEPRLERAHERDPPRHMGDVTDGHLGRRRRVRRTALRRHHVVRGAGRWPERASSGPLHRVDTRAGACLGSR